MSPTYAQKTIKIDAQSSSPPSQDKSSESSSDYVSDASAEKDEIEIELEKIVFGDDQGFREGLNADQQKLSLEYGQRGRDEDREHEAIDEADYRLDTVDDADVRLRYDLDAHQVLTPLAFLPRFWAVGST